MDLVLDGRNGLLWDSGDSRQLAKMVTDLGADRHRLAQLAFHARPSVVRRTWERVTAELLAHYASVTTAGRSVTRAS